MKNIFYIFVVLMFSAVPLSAQYRMPPIYIPEMDPVFIHLQNQVRQQAAFGDMYKGAKAGSGKRTGTAAANKGSAPAEKSVTAYNSTGSYILPQKLSSSKSGADAAESRQIFEMFLANYEKTARTDGFPPNDLAYGLSFYIVNNYLVYHDLQEKSPDDKALMSPSGDPLLALQHSYSKKAGNVTSTAEQAVYQQVKKVLSENPEILKMTDRQKQESTEMLAILTVMNYYQYETAGKNNDSKMFAKAQKAAGDSLEKFFGVPADRIKITAKGVEY